MRSATARTTGTLTALPSIAYRLAREISLTSPLIIPYLVKSLGNPCKRSHSTSVSIRIRDFCFRSAVRQKFPPVAGLSDNCRNWAVCNSYVLSFRRYGNEPCLSCTDDSLHPAPGKEIHLRYTGDKVDSLSVWGRNHAVLNSCH